MNARSDVRPQSRAEAEGQGEAPVSCPSGDKARTSGSGGASCRVCGQPIAARRRNGFCSDRCRLRASRAAKREWLEMALAGLELKVETFGGEMRTAIESLRAELLTDDGREEPSSALKSVSYPNRFSDRLRRLTTRDASGDPGTVPSRSRAGRNPDLQPVVRVTRRKRRSVDRCRGGPWRRTTTTGRQARIPQQPRYWDRGRGAGLSFGSTHSPSIPRIPVLGAARRLWDLLRGANQPVAVE